MDQTSAPSRCSGNTALALPTWPYATQDWMERMFMPGMISHRVCGMREICLAVTLRPGITPPALQARSDGDET